MTAHESCEAFGILVPIPVINLFRVELFLVFIVFLFSFGPGAGGLHVACLLQTCRARKIASMRVILYLIKSIWTRGGRSLRLCRLLLQIAGLDSTISPLVESFLVLFQLLFGSLRCLLFFLDFFHLRALYLRRR